MASETSKKVITLKTCDGETFEVEEKALLLSQTIKHMIEDDCAENIPLPNVDGRTMSKVIEYLKKHVDQDSTDTKDDIKSWDAEYMKVDTNTLYDLILAADYLDINELLELGCSQVADMIRGRSPEEIRKTFNIKNDFTPEEEEEIRRENQWNFE